MVVNLTHTKESDDRKVIQKIYREITYKNK